MKPTRSPRNPIIQPKDIKPSRSDFEVIGVFNPAVTRLGDEVILLLRIAERPVNTDPKTALAGIYDADKDLTIIKQFHKDDPQIDFSDPRLIVTPTETYLTSISHFRLARSKDGVNFRIADTPTFSPANEYETFGTEDPRITLIADTYYITYVAVGPQGVTTSLASTKDFTSFTRLGVIFCPDNKDVVIFPEQVNDKFY